MARDGVVGGRLDPSGASVTDRVTFAPEYMDAFVIVTEVDAPCRAWMQACFEEGIERRERDLIFERLCGFTTSPDGTAGHIAGWRVSSEDSEHLTVAATGTRMDGNLVMERVPGGMRLTTAMRYRTWLGRLIWSVLSRAHRRQAAPVLRAGADSLR